MLYSLNHYPTCRFEVRQALIYQLVSGLTDENGKYNYAKAVHHYPPFFDISCSAKNYKIASALTERIDPKGVGPQHNSIIDRCTGDLYENAKHGGPAPTLTALREMLLEQPESEARGIALALELFTTGSLDIFGHESTVDLDKRVVSAPFENVDFRRNGVSFLTGQHTGVIQP